MDKEWNKIMINLELLRLKKNNNLVYELEIKNQNLENEILYYTKNIILLEENWLKMFKENNSNISFDNKLVYINDLISINKNNTKIIYKLKEKINVYENEIKNKNLIINQLNLNINDITKNMNNEELNTKINEYNKIINLKNEIINNNKNEIFDLKNIIKHNEITNNINIKFENKDKSSLLNLINLICNFLSNKFTNESTKLYFKELINNYLNNDTDSNKKYLNEIDSMFNANKNIFNISKNNNLNFKKTNNCNCNVNNKIKDEFKNKLKEVYIDNKLQLFNIYSIFNMEIDENLEVFVKYKNNLKNQIAMFQRNYSLSNYKIIKKNEEIINLKNNKNEIINYSSKKKLFLKNFELKNLKFESHLENLKNKKLIENDENHLGLMNRLIWKKEGDSVIESMYKFNINYIKLISLVEFLSEIENDKLIDSKELFELLDDLNIFEEEVINTLNYKYNLKNPFLDKKVKYYIDFINNNFN